MPNVLAVLLDVFETVLRVDFDAALDGLVAASGLGRDEWADGLRLHGADLMTGAIMLEDAFAATFGLADTSAGDVPMLVRRDRELLQEHATVFPDVVPFLERERGHGVGVAFVSNCAQCGPSPACGRSTRSSQRWARR